MIKILLDILIPRFATKPFCLEGNDEEGYDAVCLYTQRDVGEKFDKVAHISYLQILGFVFFPKVRQETVRDFTRDDVLKR